MKVTFLGTGTSTGVPQIGCTCKVCTSSDEHDSRLRCSALVEEKGTRILIDCGPDFRQQILRIPFKPIDGVLITHEHYDHVGGLDDLRPFCKSGSVNVYGSHSCLENIRERMPYCFNTRRAGVPHLNLLPINSQHPFTIGDLRICPVEVMHGKMPILGFRIENLVYITDMLTMQDDEKAMLRGAKVLIVNALRYEPHPTHQTVNDACALAQYVNAERTYFIHMSHDIGLHKDVDKMLPFNIHLAYDGQTISL